MPKKVPAAARYLEVERKFDVDETTVSPSFDGIAAVARVEKTPTEQLGAVYYDTPGRDLALNKITLRRRTGGTDAGWHLKLPAGPESRTEVRLPLDASPGDQVPAELRDIVAAIVRDRPVAPVARINTVRAIQLLFDADGRALAEFCDDQVQAWASGAADSDTASPDQQWREWELELMSPGGPSDAALLDRIGNRLLDAGALPGGHGSKLGRVLDTAHQITPAPIYTDPVHRAVAEQVREVLVWDRAVRADADDAVHQLRVTIRKIRSLVKDAGDSFGDTGDILNELRELASLLGQPRDAEVLAERYAQALDQLDPKLVRGPVRARLVEGARNGYQSGLRRCLAAMRSQRYFRLLDALDALVAEIPPPVIGHDAEPTTIDAAYKRVRKATKAATAAETLAAAAAAGQIVDDSAGEATPADLAEAADEALHLIRKKAKRLRYTAGAVGAADVAAQSKAIQTLLGDHQDSTVCRRHLLQQVDAAHRAGEDTFTYGVLYQLEVELADTSRDQLWPVLAKLDAAVRKARRH